MHLRKYNTVIFISLKNYKTKELSKQTDELSKQINDSQNSNYNNTDFTNLAQSGSLATCNFVVIRLNLFLLRKPLKWRIQ